VYADNGGVADVDTVYIDNVRLTCSIPVHAPTNMLTAADAINLPAGMSMTLTYSVTVNTPAAAGQTSVVNTASVFSDGQLQPLQSTTTHPLPPTTITGTVYNDLNNSGTFTAGEPGISGVTLTLSTGAATTTDASGNYSFTNLPAGTYSVTETDPSGYVSTGDTQAPNDNMIGSITVTAGGTSAGNNFLDWKPATITGTVYNDQNGSGSFDTGEPGLSGVTVTLRNGAVIVATTTTDSGGNYSFTNLVAGTYSVTETDPAGFTSTGDTQAPNDNTISSIVLAAGATSAGNNFFDWQPATVSGSVYNDLNGDGSLTAGEPGIIGVTVTLKNGATTVATATTIAGGSYSFTNLAAGTYSVTETDPAGFVSTGDIQGSLTDNVVGNITVVAGGASAGNNFFDWQPATVSGTVYNDLNGDASLTSGEPRITGVTVTLKNGVATVATTTTDASGS
jgi:uncharacterized protein (DUF2141 family)